MADLVRTKIRKAIAYQLHTIEAGASNRYGYSYRTTIASVFDPPVSMEKMQNFPCVNLYWRRESDNSDRLSGNNQLFDLVLSAQLHCFSLSTEDPESAADNIIGDVQALFGDNFTIPDSTGAATAFVCYYKGAESFITEAAVPRVVTVIDMDVRYRIRVNQPEISN